MKIPFRNFTFFILIFSFSGFSQTTITIGSGSSTNTNTGYPAPYGNWYFGAKHQMLILSSELGNQGMTAGDISSLAFKVAAVEGTPLTGFTVKIKNTSSTAVLNTFETGLTTVYGPQTYTESNGWNAHSFSSPFYWDGTSNLLIETCFNNTTFTGNAVMFMSSTSFESSSVIFQDASGVCSSGTAFDTFFDRPNIRLQWQAPNAPPLCDFTVSSTNTCSGDIQFFDESTNSPTSWSWDFGDGTTSILENPTHTYLSNGTYTVTLTATNTFGSDSETKTNYIIVNVSGATPITAACTPNTTDGSLGFGITNVTFNTLNINSGNAIEGYTDLTCSQTTVFAGQSYNISIDHAAPTTHNCAAWIDFNNDGVFSPTSELIVSSSSSLGTSGSVTIPSNATLNTPLRMRVIADYDLNPDPTPCDDPGYGQAEDYTIIVEQDVSPPGVDFTADVFLTCDGVVKFTDLSTNIPFAWAWDFGDGNTSVQQNPTHTYTADGIYNIQLVASNSFGNNALTMNSYIEVAAVNNVISPTCDPQTLAYCCEYGIYSVQLNTINNSSVNAIEGYQDFSCQKQTDVTPGNSYLLDVRTGPDNPQDTKAWIDYNNDGVFDNATELVMEVLNAYNPQLNITIPTSGITNNTWLRMRISSDEVGSAISGCSNCTRGQVEDYAVRAIVLGIEETTDPFEIYPNPANENFHITSSKQNIKNITLYNLIGKKIIVQSNISSNNLSVDVSKLPRGTYLVSIESESGIQITRKIIIH
jgi:PKD repeat protein